MQRAKQPFPSIWVRMAEDDNEVSVRSENSARLNERLGQRLLVELTGSVLRPQVASFNDDLFRLVLQSAAREEVGHDVPQPSLQPNVENVGRIRVVDHVVVGRIGYHGVYGPIPERQSRGTALSDPRWLPGRAPNHLRERFQAGLRYRRPSAWAKPGPCLEKVELKGDLALIREDVISIYSVLARAVTLTMKIQFCTTSRTANPAHHVAGGICR